MTPLSRAMIAGWVTARSIARELPAPVADHGGWRVDTRSETERCRYIFAEAGPSIGALAAAIREPRVFIKLCDEDAVLAALLPSHWHFADRSWVMSGAASTAPPLPPGYRIETDVSHDRIAVRVLGPAGELAASGYGANALGVFAYDRIVTDASHRRLGLGRIVMAELGRAAKSDAAHVLVATDMGRALYESIGWRVRSSYASAFTPDPD